MFRRRRASKVTSHLKFEPRDAWIGVFVDKERQDKMSGDWVQRTYVCLIPFFPLVIESWRQDCFG